MDKNDDSQKPKDPRRTFRTFRTRKIVRPKALAQKIQQIIDPNRPTTPLVAEFYRHWSREIGIEWRNGHRNGVEQIFNAHLLPNFGHREVGSITREDILSFRAALREKEGRNGRGLSSSRINKILVIFGQFLAEASARYDFASPMPTINKLKQIPPEVQPLSVREAMHVADVIHPHFRPYVLLRFFTGMRTGEINALRWKNVDFDRQIIQVREIYSAGKDEDGGKTRASLRDIPFIGPVEEELKRLKEKNEGACAHVFTMVSGTRMDAKNFTNRIWNPALETLGIEKRRPYNTRHTFACLMLATGENPEYVAKLLGHTTTQMLFTTYSKYIPNAHRKDGSAFQRFLDESLGGESDDAQ